MAARPAAGGEATSLAAPGPPYAPSCAAPARPGDPAASSKVRSSANRGSSRIVCPPAFAGAVKPPSTTFRPSVIGAVAGAWNCSPRTWEFPATTLFLKSTITPSESTPPPRPPSGRGFAMPAFVERLFAIVLYSTTFASRRLSGDTTHSPAPPKSSPPVFSTIRLLRTVAAERNSTMPAPYRHGFRGSRCSRSSARRTRNESLRPPRSPLPHVPPWPRCPRSG